MVRIHAAALPWAWAQISSGGNNGAAASDTRALLPLLCTPQHDASRTSLAHMSMQLFTGVRGIGVLGSSFAGSCIVPTPGGSQEPKMYGYPMVIPAAISPTPTRMISHRGGGS